MSVLIIGGAGGIGSACANQFCAEGHDVIAVSRSTVSGLADEVQQQHYNGEESGIAELCQRWVAQSRQFRHIVIATGVLHDNTIAPEKRLEDLTDTAMQRVFAINTQLPLLWLKHLIPLLSGKKPVTVAVLSARVGSIGDNRLGGWYSYRMSKAALNMGLQCASVELARRAKQCKLIAFHPGTTDTHLSKPFQANVPAEKLFTPAFVAKRLASMMHAAEADGKLSYLDWDGKPIPW